MPIRLELWFALPPALSADDTRRYRHIFALQEDGALLISDRVEKYLPAFANHKVAVRRAGGGASQAVDLGARLSAQMCVRRSI